MTRICSKCNVIINSKTSSCPLCETKIKTNEKGEEVFPIIKSNIRKYNLVIKVLKFFSIFGTFLSLFINYSLNEKITWS